MLLNYLFFVESSVLKWAKKNFSGKQGQVDQKIRIVMTTNKGGMRIQHTQITLYDYLIFEFI